MLEWNLERINYMYSYHTCLRTHNIRSLSFQFLCPSISSPSCTLALSFYLVRISLMHPTTKSSTHALQSVCELRILLLHFQLCPRSLGVGERVHYLPFCSRKLRCALEILQGFGDFPLLEEKLSHCCHCNIAFGINCHFISTFGDGGMRNTY